MDKKEYLNNKLKKDFLQYSLLQEDSLPAEAIANTLFKVVDFRRFIQESKIEIERLLSEYLSFDKVKIDGKLSNELSGALEFGLHETVISKFQEYLDTRDIKKTPTVILNKIIHSIEKLTWSNGIANMDLAIRFFVEKLDSSSKGYERIQLQVISDSELVSKYKEAKENTFLERIKGDNLDDIIEYRNTLREYVEVKCENMLYEFTKDILDSIRLDGIFIQLQDKFKALRDYASELKNTLPELAPNAEWDAEYNKLVPTDFYYRNVEGVTAEQAFHMFIFQFLAKNEDWMANEGMLVNGELNVYTGVNGQNIANILSKLEHSIWDA